MRVGVVIPVGGFAPFLAEALDCVLAERPAEVVVVDNATPEPLVLHPDHAAACRLVRRDQRGGPGAARNTGAAALGDVELVAFCDADDAWEPGSLAPRLAALESHRDAVLAFGGVRVVGPDGRATGEAWPLPGAGRFADVAALYERNPILTSSVVARRDALGAFDEHHGAEDWELWLRTLRAGRPFVCVPEAVARYRRHGGAITADVVALAQAQRALHLAHADAVDAEVRERVLARDRAGEAAGLARERRWAQARRLEPDPRRRALLALPGARALLGRRDPYRRSG